MKSITLFLAAVLQHSAVSNAANCYLPLDVMFLQDTTNSFEDDLPNVLKQIPQMVSEISEEFPNSHFGVAEFKDKPFFPLGEEDAFCYKLGEGALSDKLDDFTWAYSLLYASGGADLPESQFQALIDVALDKAVKWRPLASGSAQPDEAGARVVIMSTDAVPHQPGDIAKYIATYPGLKTLPPNSGIVSTEDVDFECKSQDYPSYEQVAAALKAQKINLVLLTPNSDAKVTGAWTWFNEYIGQPASFYQFIEADSSNLLDGVLKAIKAVTETACPLTTTAAPGETTISTKTFTTSTVTKSTTTTIPQDGGECPEKPCECPCKSNCCSNCKDACMQGVVVKIMNDVKKVHIDIS